MDNQKRLEEAARLRPDKRAVVWRDVSLTYEQLNAKVNKMGWLLKKMGVQKGDRVAVQLLNVPEFVFSYYAIFRIGAVLVPINPVYRKREVEYIIRDAGPKAIITAPEFMGEINALTFGRDEERPAVILTQGSPAGGTFSLEELMADQPDSDIPTEYDYEDMAEIIYTSGTTGVPKGVMLSHRNIHINTMEIIKSLEISESDRTLIVAPLFHIAAQTNCMATTLYAGGTIFLISRWVSASDTLKALADNKITYFFGPPTMHAFILNAPDVKDYDLSSLRIPLTGAAPMPVEMYIRFKELLGIEPLEGYGLSETAPVVTFNPLHGKRKTGSIGLPLEGIQVKIVDSMGNDLPPGEVGEIAVKGPSVFKGYWKKEAETVEVLRGDWFHTGDLAYKDEEGYIFIVDRKKDMIIRGGLNVYPREVEEEVYKYPGVLECAVVGARDPVMGEEVVLFLTVKESCNIDVEDLKSFCHERMARYKVPRFIKIVDELPKTASGKTMKPELRKLADEIFAGRGDRQG